MIHQSAGREYLLEISGAGKVTYSGSSSSVLMQMCKQDEIFQAPIVCSENYEVNEERLLKEAAPSAANNIQATSLQKMSRNGCCSNME